MATSLFHFTTQTLIKNKMYHYIKKALFLNGPFCNKCTVDYI